MIQFKFKALSILLVIVSLVAYQNCGNPSNDGGEQTRSTVLNGTGTGNPGKASVSLTFESYANVLNDMNNPVQLQNLQLCFDRIKLEGPTGEQSIRIDRDDTPFSSSGTKVTDIEIPAGTYHEIKYYLRGENCASGKSISFTNSHGSFSEIDEIELEFEGDLVIAGTKNETVQFLMSQIVVALDKVNNNNQIKPFLEQLVEGFEHDEEDDD